VLDQLLLVREEESEGRRLAIWKPFHQFRDPFGGWGHLQQREELE
jgi:hypothetical protein